MRNESEMESHQQQVLDRQNVGVVLTAIIGVAVELVDPKLMVRAIIRNKFKQSKNR